MGVRVSSQPTSPYKIEYPTDVDFKGVPPRIRVLLVERCGDIQMENQFRKVPRKGTYRLVFLLTLAQNGYEAGVGNKDVELPKSLQHLLYGGFGTLYLPHVCGEQ
jgi:hypothetical protein